VHVEVHDDGEKPVAEKALLPEELCPRREPSQFRQRRSDSTRETFAGAQGSSDSKSRTTEGESGKIRWKSRVAT